MTTTVASTSIALCTFNGERYLPQQLSSLAAQTSLPGELVVCDDGSTDATLYILRSFAATAPFPVRVHVNQRNLGSNRNFEQAILLCQGERIALCDQDDVWLPEKLARCERAFTANPALGLVFTDGEIIDASGQRTGSRLLPNFQFDQQARALLQHGDMLPLVRYRFVTGATLVFRADLGRYCFPVQGEWTHDGWLAALISTMAEIQFLDEPLVLYRTHAAQQIGVGPGRGSRRDWWRALVDHHWLGMDWHRSALEQVLDAVARIPRDRLRPTADGFARQRDFLRMRLTLPRQRWRRPLHLARFWNEYPRRASGMRSLALDLLLPKAPSEIGSAARAGYSALRPHARAAHPSSPAR